MMPKSNSSIVWDYFLRDPNTPNVAICKHCKKPYKRCNGTTNLMDHLKRKHFTLLTRSNVQQQNEDDANRPGK